MENDKILWQSDNEKAMLRYSEENDLLKLAIILDVTEVSVYLTEMELKDLYDAIDEYFEELN